MLTATVSCWSSRVGKYDEHYVGAFEAESRVILVVAVVAERAVWKPKRIFPAEVPRYE